MLDLDIYTRHALSASSGVRYGSWPPATHGRHCPMVVDFPTGGKCACDFLDMHEHIESVRDERVPSCIHSGDAAWQPRAVWAGSSCLLHVQGLDQDLQLACGQHQLWIEVTCGPEVRIFQQVVGGWRFPWGLKKTCCGDTSSGYHVSVVISRYKYSVQSVDAFSGGPGRQSRSQAPEAMTN